MRCFVWLISVWLFCGVAMADYGEGVQAGQLALANQPDRGLMMEEMNVHLSAKENSGEQSNRFANKSAKEIASQSQGSGKGVAEALAQSGTLAQSEGQAIDLKAQQSYSKKDNKEMNLSESLQVSVVSQEVMSVNNEEGEAKLAFKDLLAIEKGELDVETFDIDLSGQNKKIIQQEYEEVYAEEEVQEPYQLQCSESLMSQKQTQDFRLEVSTELKKQEIKANISGHHTNVGFFQMDLKNNQASVLNHTQNLDVYSKDPRKTLRTWGQAFRIAPWMGEINAFSVNQLVPNMQVDLVFKGITHANKNSPYSMFSNEVYSKAPVSYCLEEEPNFANGFVAKLTTSTEGEDVSDYGATRIRRPFSAELVWEASLPSVASESWVPLNALGWDWYDAEAYQDLNDLKVCRAVATTCLEGKATKAIKGVEVTRDCWKKRISYECDVPQGADDCGQVPGTCVEDKTEYVDFMEHHAVALKTFNCQRTVTKKTRHRVAKPSNLKDEGEYNKNNDLGQAAVALNFAKEMKDSFRKEIQGEEGLFFKGDGLICNFSKGCCVGKDSGWKKVFHCNEEEKQLAERHQAKACTMVGEFQPQKGLLRKIKKIKKVSYCCYGSPLGRIIQDGAHKQLGLSRGQADNPNCRSLTPDELQQLQFERPEFDFSDLINDIKAKAMNAGVSQERMEVMQRQLQAGIKNDVARKMEGGVETTSARKNLEVMLSEGKFKSENISENQLILSEKEQLERVVQDKKMEQFK